MAVLYVPHFIQFFSDSGVPLAGGKLYTYAAGTTTPKATYTTAAGDVENTNPVILDSAGRAVIFISGSYKFTLTDSSDNVIRTTDNVTNFSAFTTSSTGFFQSFSGDAVTTAFTLTDNLGNDEKSLMIFSELEYSTNGTFASDTGWTKGTGWTIGSGVATATGAISTALEQTAGITIVQGKQYNVRYTVTRSAGSVTPNLGGTAGTARSADGTYSETIIAGSTQTISFTTSGFTGTLDNVSIRDVGGGTIRNPADYTLSGTSLTFNKAPATGTNNIFVFAPYTLINAAGAAQTAADAAIAAQAAAELAETNAETAETNAEAALAAIEGLDATSTTSLAIGTGGKSFTIQSGKGFIAGMWILATSDADPTNYMHGYVSSYSGTSLVMVATNVGGSGTHADWTLRVSGTRGATGATGSASAAGGSIAVSGSASEAAFITLAEDTDNGTNVIKLQAPASVALDKVITLPDASGTVALTSDITGGGWVPLSTQTVSSPVASVDFTSGITSTYKLYVIVGSYIKSSTDGVFLWVRTSTNGGASYDSGASDYRYNVGGSLAGTSVADDGTAAQISLNADGIANSGWGNDTGELGFFILYVSQPSVADRVKFGWNVHYTGPTGGLVSLLGTGERATAADVDAIRILFSSGNVASGTFTLYGLKDA